MKGRNDSIELLSITEINERITNHLKWDQGYDWDES